MSYYVYELADPRTNQVFYVGKGKGARINAHEAEARKGIASPKCDRIRQIEAEGLGVVKRKVAHFSDEQEAFDYEAELVCQYGLENLANLQHGGGAARNGPCLYKDRIAISTCAKAINMTRNGEIRGVLVMGKYLDLIGIIEGSKKRAFEVIDRRGHEWANAISARFGVSFADG